MYMYTAVENWKELRDAIEIDCKRICEEFENYPQSAHLSNAQYVLDLIKPNGFDEYVCEDTYNRHVVERWIHIIRIHDYYVGSSEEFATGLWHDLVVDGPSDAFCFSRMCFVDNSMRIAARTALYKNELFARIYTK
jgi:hypothetical protein